MKKRSTFVVILSHRSTGKPGRSHESVRRRTHQRPPAGPGAIAIYVEIGIRAAFVPARPEAAASTPSCDAFSLAGHH
jgi:hypothetical protein